MSELAARYDMSFAAVQKHVAMLEGLVRRARDNHDATLTRQAAMAGT